MQMDELDSGYYPSDDVLMIGNMVVASDGTITATGPACGRAKRVVPRGLPKSPKHSRRQAVDELLSSDQEQTPDHLGKQLHDLDGSSSEADSMDSATRDYLENIADGYDTAYRSDMLLSSHRPPISPPFRARVALSAEHINIQV